jgi:hypothetical protein
MSGNLASTCHQPMTVFATINPDGGKTQANQEVCKGLGNKTGIGIKLAKSFATHKRPQWPGEVNGSYQHQR